MPRCSKMFLSLIKIRFYCVLTVLLCRNLRHLVTNYDVSATFSGYLALIHAAGVSAFLRGWPVWRMTSGR